MEPNSSIFSSEPWKRLLESYRETRDRWSFARLGALIALSAPGLAYAVLNPNDFFWRRFSIDATIRAAHQPADDPFPGFAETTEDGLHFTPSTLKPNRNVLVVGDSTSYWLTYPPWVQRRSIGEGDPWAVFTAARGGAQLTDVADTLAYILANNHRKFDMVLAKPSAGIMWNLVYDPEDAYQYPPIGSGYFLPHSGAPVDSRRSSFFDHFLSTYRRRSADLDNWRRNKRMNSLVRYNLAQPGVAISSEIPREAREDVDRLAVEYEKGILNLLGIARLHQVPIVFLTTHCRAHDPNEPPFRDGKTRYAAYKGKYLLAGFQHRVVDRVNEVLRTVCRREGVPLIDSQKYLAALPQDDLFQDAFHIHYRFEEGHGKFIYEQLKELGF